MPPAYTSVTCQKSHISVLAFVPYLCVDKTASISFAVVSRYTCPFGLHNQNTELDRVIGRVRLLSLSICLSVCRHKSASSPDPGHSISAEYFQTVGNVEKVPCLCCFLPDSYTLQVLSNPTFRVGIVGTPINHTQIPDHLLNNVRRQFQCSGYM